MNKVIISGRIVRDTESKYTAGDKPMCIASYTIACQRKYPHQDEADYIKCKAFGKNGEFADKYFKKDHTHTSLLGAKTNAKCVAQGLMANKSPLAKYLKSKIK